jgi:RNA polymerase sigma-70 factor, ECF subfamily
MEAAAMQPDEPSNLELVRRIREGDTTQFRVLFARHEAAARQRVLEALPHVLLRKVDPEDILQDAWLVATQRFSTFEGAHEGSFGAWLAQIVTFKTAEVVRYYLDADKRATRRERTRGARPDTAAFPGRWTTPSQRMIVRELEVRAAAATDALSPDYRLVLELVHARGLTLKQAAQVLRRGYEATKKLHARALARLRSLMGLEE